MLCGAHEATGSFLGQDKVLAPSYADESNLSAVLGAIGGMCGFREIVRKNMYSG